MKQSSKKKQYRFEPKFDILERKGHLIKKVKLKEISLVKNKKLERGISTKNIEIELNKNWYKSKVIIDGKMIPFMELEIKQGKSTNGILECKLVIFPNKVILIK